ncbi:hypothetical protein BDW75DRAFT_240818 [Aspergillus navahoensis]
MSKVKPTSAPDETVTAADVESCRLSPPGGSSFLAFGARPPLCPAARVFGPRIVGLLVGLLLDKFRGEWVLEDKNGDRNEMVGLGEGRSTQYLPELIGSSRLL